MCHECNGKGYVWVGAPEGEAMREVCDPCQGSGRGGSLILLSTCALAAWALALGAIWLLQSALTQIVN